MNPVNMQPGAKPPSPEQLAAALQTLMQAISFQPQQQAEYQAMIEAATKVDALDLQIKKLSEEKKTAATVLIPLLHKLSGGRLVLANLDEILACTSQDRRVAKKQIAAFFTKEFPNDAAKAKAQTEALWKSVPSKVREYISVRRPGETPAPTEEEDAEVPVVDQPA